MTTNLFDQMLTSCLRISRDLLIRHERLSHGRSRGKPQEEHEINEQTDELLLAETSAECSRDVGGDEGEEPAPVEGSVVPHPTPPYQPTDDAPGSPVDPSYGVIQTSPGRESVPPYDAGTDEMLDGFTRFLTSGALDSYPLPSPGNSGQTYPTFTLEPFMDAEHATVASFVPQTTIESGNLSSLGEPESLSRFCSRLPSPQADDVAPERNFPTDLDCRPSHTGIVDISIQDREFMLQQLVDFTALVPDLRLPSRLSVSRYLRGYVEGFHEHLPFLHIPSMTVGTSSIELLLAMAAVGSQYCFESEKGLALFHAARAIANERIRRRDAYASMASRSDRLLEPASSESPTGTAPTSLPTSNGPLGIPSSLEGSVPSPPCHPLMQTAQALLILMAMATWSKHGELLREALAIQSILASIVREDGLRMEARPSDGSADWQAEMWYESVLRTKYIVFCFFNLHCIVYNIPPLILSTELQMRLPCSAAEFRADTAAVWKEAARGAEMPPAFQTSSQRLFSQHGGDMTARHSSLANYILIHAIIQHIFLARQTAGCRSGFGDASLPEKDTALLKNALRNWQLGWERSRESSLDPSGTHGPVAFNSTALLRLAYVRINIDTGPSRALGTRDPQQIAQALRDMPMIRRSPDLTPALLHSAHAISIPIKIGIQLVARTQTFVWSIQHSLSSLECALLLSKWLEGVSQSAWSGTDYALSVDERRIVGLVKTMLDETEFAVPDELVLDVMETAKHLNIGILKVWATIFKGSQTWAIVDVIGSSLELYATMLQAVYC